MKTTGKTLQEAGELAFISAIKPMMAVEGNGLVRSIGDDCLACESFGSDLMVVTTDTFVDTVHFSADFATWDDMGRRCMAASVSDIAAMGGVPVTVVTALSLPRDMILDDAVTFFRGLAEEADSYGCRLAGGETTSTPGPLTVTVTVIGRTEPARIVYRSGAQPGDGIHVTGTLGDAMAGLETFRRGDDSFPSLGKRFITPRARVAEARLLTARCRVSAMIDLSDGLATDVRHICNESGCGAEIDVRLLPFSDEYLRACGRYGLDPAEFAVASGEDYQLLFTARDDVPAELLETPVTRIGTITEKAGDVRVRLSDTRTKPLTGKGYEHFTS